MSLNQFGSFAGYHSFKISCLLIFINIYHNLCGVAQCQLKCQQKKENMSTGFEGETCSKVDEAILFDNNYLERQMTQHAIMSQLDKTSPIILAHPNRTFDLFMRMVTITRGYCPNEYVPTSWVTHLTELFYVLHKNREFQYKEVLSEDNFISIRDILDKCEAKQHRVNLTNGGGEKGSSCEADHVGGKAWGYCKDKLCKHLVPIVPISEKTGMKLRNKHYIPELAWNVIDATQAICFHEFSASYRMFHVLEEASEKLFTPEIRRLWYNPPYLQELKRKARLLGPGSDESMYNMEICIGSAYHVTNEANKRRTKESDVTYIPRLVRPTIASNLRRKRRSTVAKSIAKFSDVFCAKSKSELRLPKCGNNLRAGE